MCIQPKISNANNEQIRQIIEDNGADKPGFWFGSLGKYSYANDIKFYVNFAEFGLVSCLHFGKHCSVALNVKLLFNRNHDYKSLTTSASRLFYGRPWVIQQKGQILIGNDVWLGNDVNILSGVRIGDGAIIGAGAVVSKDIPPYAIAVGNPIRVIKYRYTPEQIEALLRIRWWDWEDEKIAANKDLFSEPVEKFIEKFDVKVPAKSAECKIEGLKSETFLFYPDFEDPYSIWQKVISEYLKTFNKSSDTTLILAAYESEKDRLNDFIKEKSDDDAPHIVIHKPEKGLFSLAEYYIVNRCPYAMEHIQLCDDNDVKLLSGVDVPVFYQMNKEE